jgi:hypothetical protein
LTNSFARSCRFFLITLIATVSGLAQTPSEPATPVLAAALPDAPSVQQPAQQFEPATRPITGGPVPPARRYAQVIEPGQGAQTFSAPEKLVFSFTEVARPITLFPALYSASYEQIFETDPKYGHDLGAYGEKFGAAMLRSASVRVLSDGIFAGVFHQDPRYYRVGQGNFFHRTLLSMEQAVIRRSDDGVNQFNYSGITGRAVAAALVVTYYPQPSITARVVGLTFVTSIATDAGGNLVLEFLPSIVRKAPIMKKLRLE